MELGFSSIGNATFICYDQVPVLVTDPWLGGETYFGSWDLTHGIPASQLDDITKAKYAWISHGHQDHLSLESLIGLLVTTILLPDHYGGRIYDSLTKAGFNCQILQNGKWYELSARIKICCLADYNQDAKLFVSLGDWLLVNMNDSAARGDMGQIRNIIKEFRPDKTLLAGLSGHGDADMINFHDEDGQRIVPVDIIQSKQNIQLIGLRNSSRTKQYGARYFIPSSSMHRYQRSDSAWANQYLIESQEYQVGWDPKFGECLPPFGEFDCIRVEYYSLDPVPHSGIRPPGDFGDDWSEVLDKAEFELIKAYFTSFSHLFATLDFINFRVGEEDNLIEFNTRKFDKGLTFEAPRNSLVKACSYRVFDDILIGNFMKTTLHGNWSTSLPLYPNFTPYVAKYGDNGGARTKDDLKAYFAYYRTQNLLEWFMHRIASDSLTKVRAFVLDNLGDNAFDKARKSYHFIRRRLM